MSATLPLVVAFACQARPLVPRSDAGFEAGSVSPPIGGDGAAGGGGAGGAGGAGGTGGIGGIGGSIGGAGAGGSAYCPRVDEVGDDAPSTTPPPPIPTAGFPFSCQSMPEAFLFPPPGEDVAGAFTRCASFEVGAVRAVAVSPDGRSVAMVTDDGLARVIEVESRQVTAVLAPPRAMITAVAYEPHGRGVLTLAHAQREVTLWRAVDWTPVWRVTLPGTPYYHLGAGGIAFAPDGQSAVVSPGSDTFLLDVANGAILAQRSAAWDTVQDVAYGWNGQRIVVAEPSLAAHCQHNPNGGKVTVLDAATLAVVATFDFGDYSNPGGWRGPIAFRASPADDLVLVSPRVEDPPGVRAFRLSDGGALPAPAVTAMPAAFMPDGASVLMLDGGALVRLRLSDGATLSVTMLGDAGPMGMSADGGVLAFGGSGAALLRVLNAGSPVPTSICTAGAPSAASGLGPSSSLSFDGQTLAIAGRGEVRIVRRSDGAVTSRILDGLSPESEPMKPILSPRASFVVTLPEGQAGTASVFPRSGGPRVGAFFPDGNGWSWTGFAFSPREDRIYSNGYRNGAYGLTTVQPGSFASSVVPIANFTVVIGTSNGCPVLYESARGAWRSCGDCEDPPVGGGSQYNPVGAQGAVLSSDGVTFGTWSDVNDPGVKLWTLPPEPGRVATLTARGGWRGWEPIEFAVAVSPGGARVLTGALPSGSCFFGPAFPIEVHDVGAGQVIDTLPPGATATDGAVRTVAYGAQLWCAR